MSTSSQFEKSFVLQKLCSETAFTPRTWCIFILLLGINMVLRWCYVVLTMEQSRNNYVINICFTYNTYWWLSDYRPYYVEKTTYPSSWEHGASSCRGKLSLRCWAFAWLNCLRKWRRGWHYVRSNAKIVKYLFFVTSLPKRGGYNSSLNFRYKASDSYDFGTRG